jgi:hypothetical protein
MNSPHHGKSSLTQSTEKRGMPFNGEENPTGFEVKGLRTPKEEKMTKTVYIGERALIKALQDQGGPDARGIDWGRVISPAITYRNTQESDTILGLELGRLLSLLRNCGSVEAPIIDWRDIVSQLLPEESSGDTVGEYWDDLLSQAIGDESLRCNRRESPCGDGNCPARHGCHSYGR